MATVMIFDKRTGQRDYAVDAEIYGLLAVHHTPYSDEALWSPHEWTISHIPTGGAILHHLASQRMASSLAKSLSDFIDWDFASVKLMNPEDRYWITLVLKGIKHGLLDADDVFSALEEG